MPNHRHHITIREFDRRDNETNTADVGLHHKARGLNNHIQQQRHKNRSPQRWKLP